MEWLQGHSVVQKLMGRRHVMRMHPIPIHAGQDGGQDVGRRDEVDVVAPPALQREHRLSLFGR